MTKKEKWILVSILGITAITLSFIYIKSKGNKKNKGGFFNKVKADDWANDSDFFTTSSGKNLQKLANQVSIKLKRNTGLDGKFNEEKYKEYKNNKSVFWAVYDINNNKFIDFSSNADTIVYGASVPKVCVAAAAFSNNNGILPNDRDYQNVIKLLVKSDNNTWDSVQELAGGKDAVNEWSEKMGFKMKPARRGGNNASAKDMARFWNDVCRNNFKGAEDIFKISSSCQTSSSRSKKCMPKDVYLGGKTGTYEKSNHDCCWIQTGDKFYSICVLTELGSNGSDVIAQMYRGLYEEYINNKD